MLDQLRDQFARDLAACSLGVLTMATDVGPQALPVRYVTQGLELYCLLPRWSDSAYYLEERRAVLFLVLFAHAGGRRWLRYKGMAQPHPVPPDLTLPPEWGALPEPFTLVRLTPTRIDRCDHRRGILETLDLT